MARAAPASVRAADIVSFLTAHPARGYTISELAQHLGMNIASAHATLAVLCDFGFLVRDPAHKTYVLGPALAATGYAALARHPAIEQALEQASILAAELDVEVGLHAIAGRDTILLARRCSVQAPSGIGQPGDRAPLLAPFGAVFIAWANESVADEWIDRSRANDTLADNYRNTLADIRARGFGVPLQAMASPSVMKALADLRDGPADDAAEQRLAEIVQQTDEMLLPLDRLSSSDEIVFKTVAAPIFDPLGQVMLSLSITGTPEPVRVDRILELGRRLVRSANIVTSQSHGRAPGHAPSASATGR